MGGVIVTTCPTCRPQSGRPLPPRDRYCHHVSDVSAPVREAAAAMRPLRRPHVSDVAAPVRKAVADSKFTCAQPRVSFRHVRHVGHRVSGEVPRVQTTRLTGTLWRGVVWTRGDTSDTWKSILLRAYEVSEEGVRRV